MFKKILIASQNPGKIREIRSLLTADFPEVEVLSAADLPETRDLDPEETGETFAENAALKARAFARATRDKYPVLADDSGIVVPALTTDQEKPFPGVYSARWREGSDRERLAALLKMLAEKYPQASVEDSERAVYYECVFCFYDPTVSPSKTEFFTGRCDGHLAFEPHGENGFGYDPAFIPEGHEQTFGELEPAVKNRISHRAQALRAFQVYFSSRFS